MTSRQKLVTLEICKTITRLNGTRYKYKIPRDIDSKILSQNFLNTESLMKEYAMLVTGSESASCKFVENYTSRVVAIKEVLMK